MHVYEVCILHIESASWGSWLQAITQEPQRSVGPYSLLFASYTWALEWSRPQPYVSLGS